MLADRALWKKWAGGDTGKAADWAALPEPPKVKVVLPAADQAPATWRYTTAKPGDGWFKPGFDCASWRHRQGRPAARPEPHRSPLSPDDRRAVHRFWARGCAGRMSPKGG